MMESKELVPLEEAGEQVARVCRRLALLHLAFAETLCEELGAEKGKQMALKAIKNYGHKVGREVKKAVKARGLDNTPANYREDLPRFGMYDKWETVEVNGEKRTRIHGCVMGQEWKRLGADELGRLYCYIDPAKYIAFNPDYKLIHTKAVPAGDPYCELTLRSTTEKEREDFAADKDWTYLDK
jgi:hypothetical protein